MPMRIHRANGDNRLAIRREIETKSIGLKKEKQGLNSYRARNICTSPAPGGDGHAPIGVCNRYRGNVSENRAL